MSDTAALWLDRVVRTFIQGPSRLEVLCGASLALQPGEIVALVGPSGAGKSTLLHLAGLLERPDGGEVYLLGRPCGGMSDADRTAARRKTIGFVYQYHHLLPEFSALENVVIPQMIAGRSRREARQRAGEILEGVGLAKRASHRPARLSGGEQQRVAIGRALANSPAVLLADEPTGNLDPHTAESVFGLIRQLVHEARLAALIATHNLDLARRLDRVLTIQDGLVTETHRSGVASAAVG